MIVKETQIHGAWILQPRVFSDDRGYFFECWNRKAFAALGIEADFVQDNESRSRRNVLRGLHYQVGSAAQGKLVWAKNGEVFDVVVDLRVSSPTYGRWDAFPLSAETNDRLWVPPGCAHGFLVTSKSADFCYKCTAPYLPEAERTLRWNDVHLGIAWPLKGAELPVLSRKDSLGLSWEACEKYY